MGIRDQELARLQKYAEGLGIKVVWSKNKSSKYGAMWVLDQNNNVELHMYTWTSASKTLLVLNFLHELAHHLAYVHQGRTLSDALIKALNHQSTETANKKHRELVYKAEVSDSSYRKVIAHEVGLKIPESKIDLDIAVDDFIYYTYWQENRFPKLPEIREFKKQWKDKNNA